MGNRHASMISPGGSVPARREVQDPPVPPVRDQASGLRLKPCGERFPSLGVFPAVPGDYEIAFPPLDLQARE